MKKFLSLLMMTMIVTTAWAADAWVETAVTSLKTGDVVVIVDKTSSRAMSNNNGTSAAPSATEVTLSAAEDQITSTVGAELQWIITVDNTTTTRKYQFNVEGTQNYLYTANANNGVRVGTNTNNVFIMTADFLNNEETGRYVGVYNNQEWRCYTSVNNNIIDTETAFYKKVVVETVVAAPVITLDPAEGPYYEGSSVTATITCETAGATISYSTDGTTWTEGSTVTLTQTTTLQAKASLNGTESVVVEKEVTFVPQASGLVDELTYDVVGVTGTSYSTWQDVTGTSGTVYAGNTAGGNNAIQMRSNNSNSGIVSTSSIGNAKSVTLTWNSNTTSGRTVDIYGSNTAYTQATDLYDSSKQGTLLGSLTVGDENQTVEITEDYAFIGIRSHNGALYLDAISIEWEKVASAVAAPVITLDPAEGPYYEGSSVTVNISCETPDAVIYYSTDGGQNWTQDNTLTVTETTTVNAKAVLLEHESNIASKTITFVPAPTTVATVAEYKALEIGVDFVFTGNVTVTYANGNNLYVKDNTGSALIFGYNMPEFTQGQVLEAGWTGKTKNYNGLLEVENPANLAATNETVEVVPTEYAVPVIIADNANEYIIVKNVTLSEVANKNFTITDADGNTIAGRTNFSGVTHPTDLTVAYDVTCCVAVFNGTVQLYPTAYDKVVVPTYYNIAIDQVENGVVTADLNEAKIGDIVTLTVTPDQGYKLESITVKAGYMEGATPSGINMLADGWVELGEIETTKVDETHYTFVVPEGLNYTPNTEFKVTPLFSQVTAITGINVDNIGSGARFVNPMGQVSDRPFKGLNIVVDGNKTYKIVVK
jgi:hypothetical protein